MEGEMVLLLRVEASGGTHFTKAGLMKAVGATQLFFIGGVAVSTRFSMVSAGRCERASSSSSTPTKRA
jgi:hypothetical protein